VRCPTSLGCATLLMSRTYIPAPPVGQKDFVADDERRSMQYGARRRRRCFALSLPLHHQRPTSMGWAGSLMSTMR
jgi:hypothetical protein